MQQNSYKILPIIGLEVHIELNTSAKMFCSCPNSPDDTPNSNICPICLAYPGAIPTLNKHAIELAIQFALATKCEIARKTSWDRKNYFYPDLPKGYQITQQFNPIAYSGTLPGQSHVRIKQVHLEEDAGKTVNLECAADLVGAVPHNGIDFNRAGAPLLEIVTEPDFESAKQAVNAARELQRLVKYLGISKAILQKGHMRFEPNVNLAIADCKNLYITPVVEVKNLNSFRNLQAAIEFEITRQFEEFQQSPDKFRIEEVPASCDDSKSADQNSLLNLTDRTLYIGLSKFPKINRGFDADQCVTIFQRSKESARDYRFFAEPDLPVLDISTSWVSQIRDSIPELPACRSARFEKQFCIPKKSAHFLTSTKDLADLFENSVSQNNNFSKICVNIILGALAEVAKNQNKSIPELKISSRDLSEIADLVLSNKISPNSAQKIAGEIAISGKSADQLASELNLFLQNDENRIANWVKQAIAENPDTVESANTPGKKQQKARTFLLGQVMKLSRSQAPAAVASKILNDLLKNN